MIHFRMSDSTIQSLELAEQFNTTKNPLLIKTGDGFTFIKSVSWQGFFERIKNLVFRVFGHNLLLKNKMEMYEIAKKAVVDLLQQKSDLVIAADDFIHISKKIKKLGKYAEMPLSLYLMPQSPSCQRVARRFLNFSAKKNMEHNSCVEKKLHEKYDGNTASDSLNMGCHYVEGYLKSLHLPVDADINGLKRIAENRRILKEISRFDAEAAAKDIFDRIQSLDDQHSNRVVQLQDGATFCISGGCKKHCVTYEVKRVGKAYFFFIHNRGHGSKDTQLHGNLEIEKDGQSYIRSSVCIEVDKAHLSRQFFYDILQAEQSTTMALAYGFLKQYLLMTRVGGKVGAIVKTEEEIIVERLRDKLLHAEANFLSSGEIASLSASYDKACDAVIKKNIFHSKQQYGTCTESNKTAPEESMCDKKTRKYLKLYTVHNLLADLFFTRLQDKADKKALMYLGDKRISHLHQRIASLV